jgi:hypothetical protein
MSGPTPGITLIFYQNGPRKGSNGFRWKKIVLL